MLDTFSVLCYVRVIQNKTYYKSRILYSHQNAAMYKIAYFIYWLHNQFICSIVMLDTDEDHSAFHKMFYLHAERLPLGANICSSCQDFRTKLKHQWNTLSIPMKIYIDIDMDELLSMLQLNEITLTNDRPVSITISDPLDFNN